MAAQPQAALTILRRKQVEARTGLSRSTIYAKLTPNPKRPREFDATFPHPIKLGNGAKAVGFIESEINAWLTAQVEASRKTAAPAQAGGEGSSEGQDGQQDPDHSLGVNHAPTKTAPSGLAWRAA